MAATEQDTQVVPERHTKGPTDTEAEKSSEDTAFDGEDAEPVVTLKTWIVCIVRRHSEHHTLRSHRDG